jgi:hypothetical protein
MQEITNPAHLHTSARSYVSRCVWTVGVTHSVTPHDVVVDAACVLAHMLVYDAVSAMTATNTFLILYFGSVSISNPGFRRLLKLSNYLALRFRFRHVSIIRARSIVLSLAVKVLNSNDCVTARTDLVHSRVLD